MLDHYGGNNLPEKRFLTNVLDQQFGIDPSIQDEFVNLFEIMKILRHDAS